MLLWRVGIGFVSTLIADNIIVIIVIFVIVVAAVLSLSSLTLAFILTIV